MGWCLVLVAAFAVAAVGLGGQAGLECYRNEASTSTQKSDWANLLMPFKLQLQLAFAKPFVKWKASQTPMFTCWCELHPATFCFHQIQSVGFGDIRRWQDHLRLQTNICDSKSGSLTPKVTISWCLCVFQTERKTSCIGIFLGFGVGTGDRDTWHFRISVSAEVWGRALGLEQFRDAGFLLRVGGH